MQNSPSLLEVQNWLRWIITDPRGVECALSRDEVVEKLDPKRYVEPHPKLLSSFIETPNASRNERLSVYAEAYFSRLLEVLENDFATTRRALGDEFPRVCGAYLELHPSRSPNIENIGARFPTFLRTYSGTSEVPYIHDIADLEWGKIEAFYAPDSEKINLDSLRETPESAWPEATFETDPSVRLMSFDYPIDLLCEIEDDGKFESARKALKKERIFVLIQKQNDWPVVKRVEENQYLVLSSIREGRNLSDILSRLSGLSEVNESTSSEVMAWFSQWIQSGLISAVRFLGH